MRATCCLGRTCPDKTLVPLRAMIVAGGLKQSSPPERGWSVRMMRSRPRPCVRARPTPRTAGGFGGSSPAAGTFERSLVEGSDLRLSAPAWDRHRRVSCRDLCRSSGVRMPRSNGRSAPPSSVPLTNRPRRIQSVALPRRAGLGGVGAPSRDYRNAPLTPTRPTSLLHGRRREAGAR